MHKTKVHSPIGQFGSVDEIFFNPEGDHTDKVGVTWVASWCRWPPAIDSQLLMAVLQTNGYLKRNIRSVLDMGCGVGYLGICVAKLNSAINEICFADVTPSALALSRYNFEKAFGREERRTDSSYILCNGLERFIREGRYYDLLISAPPYLPYKEPARFGIEIATNGTFLLEDVVARGLDIADEVVVTFSDLASPEFRAAVRRAKQDQEQLQVRMLDSHLVPFRIPWLDPVSPEERGITETDRRYPALAAVCEDKKRYLQKLRDRRGLIDLDNLTRDQRQNDRIRQRKEDNRGFRFWQEIHMLSIASVR